MDDIGYTTITVNGEDLEVNLNTAAGVGYQMKNSQYLEIENLNGFLGPSFIIGFWLYSKNPGIIHAANNTYSPLIMPVFAQGSSALLDGMMTPKNDCGLMVYETTQNNGKNKLIVYIAGQTDYPYTDTSAVITSSEYTTNIFHHFIIQHAVGIDRQVQIYIDGTKDSGTTTTGEVPYYINSSADNFSVNRYAIGPETHIASNTGVLDEFFVCTNYISVQEISRVVSKGVLYTFDSAFSQLEEIYQPILFDDPSTIQTTSVYSNKGNIFVGRSDGTLLKGSKTLWENRLEFSDQRLIDNLTVITKDGNKPTILDGKLTLTNQVIRI